jgi:hypothetical protein
MYVFHELVEDNIDKYRGLPAHKRMRWFEELTYIFKVNYVNIF